MGFLALFCVFMWEQPLTRFNGGDFHKQAEGAVLFQVLKYCSLTSNTLPTWQGTSLRTEVNCHYAYQPSAVS